MQAVDDSGRCGTLLRAPLDVCIGPPPGAIIDGSHFVSLVDGCHGARAEFFSFAPTVFCRFSDGEGSFYHAHVSFFPEGLFDLSNELFCRAIVVPAHRGRQKVLSGIFTFEFGLGRPDSRARKSGFRDTQWDSSPKGEGIVLVCIVHLFGQIMDGLQVEWLSRVDGVLVRAHQDVAYFT